MVHALQGKLGAFGWKEKDKFLHACKALLACFSYKQDYEQALKIQPQEKNNKKNERNRELIKREK